MINLLNETDIYCLHYIFVPRISSILGSFGSEWNNHKLSTEDNRSSNQLFIQGMLDSDNESQSSTAQLLPNQIAGNCTIARKRKGQRTVNTNMGQKHMFATISS